MIAALLCLLIGLLLGFYGQTLLDNVQLLVETKREELEAKKTGVVRVSRQSANPNEPIDLSAPGGGVVKRQTPAQAEEQRAADRARVLRENHS